MRPRLAKTVLALTASLSLPLAAAPAHAGSASPHPAGQEQPAHAGPTTPDPVLLGQLARTYEATAKYGYLPNALADGYQAHMCLARDQGGMGYHYFNESRFGSLDPAKPAGLLYEDDGNGGRRLVGVEWVVPTADAQGKRPQIFGQDFQGPMAGHYPGMPRHYDLHAWLYKPNRNGLFAQWNPDVTCPSSDMPKA